MNLTKWKKYLEPFKGPYSDRAIPCIPYLDWLEECHYILDLGCGTGNLVRYLIEEKGKKARGITLNPKEVSKNLFECDIHEILLKDNSVDGIIAWDVIEHTLAPFIVLSEIYRVLKPGGKALVFIPGTEWINCNYHCIVLNQAQFIHLAEMVGFSKIKVEFDETRGATANGTIYKIQKS